MADEASEMQASASLFASACVDVNLAFYQQKKKDPNPYSAVQLSHDVKACWDSLRAKINRTAEAPFQAYASCLENTGNNMRKCAKLHEDLLETFYKAEADSRR